MSEPEGGHGRRFGGCAEAIGKMSEAHGKLYRAIGDMTGLLQRMTPVVLGVRTFTLDANGSATDTVHVPYNAIAVDHIKIGAGTANLFIANVPYSVAGMPASGPGIAVCRTNGFTVVNLTGRAWSVYNGSAGDLVTVTLLGTPAPPNSGT